MGHVDKGKSTLASDRIKFHGGKRSTVISDFKMTLKGKGTQRTAYNLRTVYCRRLLTLLEEPIFITHEIL